MNSQLRSTWLPISVRYFQGTSSVKISLSPRRFHSAPLLSLLPARHRSFPWDTVLVSFLSLCSVIASMQGSGGPRSWSEAEHTGADLSHPPRGAGSDKILEHGNCGGEWARWVSAFLCPAVAFSASLRLWANSWKKLARGLQLCYVPVLCHLGTHTWGYEACIANLPE